MNHNSSSSLVCRCAPLLGIVLFALIMVRAVNSQTYTLFYPPNSSNNVFAYCTGISLNPPLQYNCPLTLSTGVYSSEIHHGHFHNSLTRPFSSMTCPWPNQCSPTGGKVISANTSTQGKVALYINTTAVGQAEKVTITGPGGATAVFDFSVGYTGIYFNHHDEVWYPIDSTTTGADSGHGNYQYNRWMRSTPAYGLYDATQDYLAANPGQAKICTGDMSLPFGGVFDINQNWTTPHSNHDKGRAADVGGPGNWQCPSSYRVNVAAFINACVAQGASATLSYEEDGDAHCQWP